MAEFRSIVGEGGWFQFGTMTPLSGTPTDINGDTMTLAEPNPQPSTPPPLYLKYDRATGTFLLIFRDDTSLRQGLWQSPTAVAPAPDVGWGVGGIVF